jgi:hypothetical protein
MTFSRRTPAIRTRLTRVTAGLAGAAAFGGCLVCASPAHAVAPVAPRFTPISFFESLRIGSSAMSSARAGAAGAITDGKVLIAGGYDASDLPLTTIDLFSLAIHHREASSTSRRT